MSPEKIKEGVAVTWLAALTLLMCLGYLPARGVFWWYLRVAIPEIGVLLLLLALPALLWLDSRGARRFGRVAAALLILGAGWPWLSLLGVATEARQQLPAAFTTAGAGAHRNYPVQVTTENYHSDLSWDRYEPLSEPRSTRVLFIHGGSWRRGSREDFSDYSRYLAQDGYRVYSIDYRLAPKHPYPAAVEDIEAALDRIHQLGPGPVVLFGRSAGGHLALQTAYTTRQRVDGAIGFYPPVDMQWSYEHPSNPWVLDSPASIRDFMQAGPEEAPDRYAEASPLRNVNENTPPTLLLHGGRDCLVFPRQSEMLAERLTEAGRPNYLLYLPWCEHGGDYFLHGPTGRASSWAVRTFLESVAKAP